MLFGEGRERNVCGRTAKRAPTPLITLRVVLSHHISKQNNNNVFGLGTRLRQPGYAAGLTRIHLDRHYSRAGNYKSILESGASGVGWG